MENWKDIKGLEGKYQISTIGRVKSLNYRRTGKDKIMVPYADTKGYLRVGLMIEGKKKEYPIHRLVSDAFIEKKDGCNYVDHIDGNILNNSILNLKWCTQKENCNNPIAKENYRKSKLGKKNPNYGKTGAAHHTSKPIIQYTLEMEYVNEYPSTQECVNKNVLFKKAGISRNLVGVTKSYKGYIFKYKL